MASVRFAKDLISFFARFFARFFISGVLVLGSTSAFATEAKEATLKELMKITDAETNFEKTAVTITNSTTKQILDQAFPGTVMAGSREEKYRDEVEKVTKETFRKAVDIKGFREDYLQVNREHYSEEDLVNIIAFYKTETGKKVAMQSQPIMMEMMHLTQDRAQKAIADLPEKLKAIQKKYEKKSKDVSDKTN